jgi:hypothetical protein
MTNNRLAAGKISATPKKQGINEARGSSKEKLLILVGKN